jgi:ubiquinone/menaquinone biosynthesis C-methylase UbiE
VIERMDEMLAPQHKNIIPEQTNTSDFWDDLYSNTISPWDTGRPDQYLQQIIAKEGMQHGAGVLDVGCGTGTNAIWLAKQGFHVTGVDISSVAIARAKAKMSLANVTCNFLVADILTLQMPSASFEFAFDLGCFHQFDLPHNRDLFAYAIRTLLKPTGKLLTISGSADGPVCGDGPPRRSCREIVAAFEPYFRLLSLRAAFFDREGSERSRAWICLLERRPDDPPRNAQKTAVGLTSPDAQ